MPSGLFRNVWKGTRALDRIIRNDPEVAARLTEADVERLMRGRPTSITTSANGTRILIWQQRPRLVTIYFTADHRFIRIHHRRNV